MNDSRESGRESGLAQETPASEVSKRESAANPASPPERSVAQGGAFGSYCFLLIKLDEKFEKQGILDPLTWSEVDNQICEDPALSRGQTRILHAHCQNRLRLAGGAWG